MKTKFENNDVTKVVEIYTDGGIIGKNPSNIGGTYAWCGVDKDGNIVARGSAVVPAVPGRPITNNHTEQMAIIRALEAMPMGWAGKVCSDSQIALGRVFMDWATNNLPPNVIRRTEQVKLRIGNVTWELLQGHPTKADLAAGIGAKRGYRVSEFNVWCDKECGRLAKEFIKNQNS